MKQLKLLLADDHEVILEGLCALLKDEPGLTICGLAYDGEEVLQKLTQAEPPDLLILDINMPKMDGLEVTRRAKTKYPEVKILVLSMHNRSEFIRKLMHSGADGYLLKNSGKKELLTAIHTIASGESYFSQEVLKRSFDEQFFSNSAPGSTLSNREKQVVKLIAQGFNSKLIAAELNISTHTVDSHRKKILAKINANNSVDIVKYALKTGIINGFDIV